MVGEKTKEVVVELEGCRILLHYLKIKKTKRYHVTLIQNKKVTPTISSVTVKSRMQETILYRPNRLGSYVVYKRHFRGKKLLRFCVPG